jgi:diguanylate cyclase
MTPVDIARQALHRLAELGLPPTPENYETQYRAIAGLPPRDLKPESAVASQTLEMVRALLGAITRANDSLQADLTRFSRESSTLLVEAGQPADAKTAQELLAAMTASSTWLLNQVDAARSELKGTREQLNDVHRRLEQFQSMALTDPLTGIPNRRGLGAALSREISRARRHGGDLCLALLDIDHFKRVNDQYGHGVGDRTLQHLANVIKPAIRETDVLGRFGGEEFVLVLPDTPLPGAEFTLNRLLRLLERTPLTLPEAELRVCFSAGLAQWCDGESGEHLIERADRAMYAAKRAGRGRVMVAELSPAEPETEPSSS